MMIVVVVDPSLKAVDDPELWVLEKGFICTSSRAVCSLPASLTSVA